MTRTRRRTAGDAGRDTGPLGYSGNNPIAKCPTGPADRGVERALRHGDYSYQDARRTAGNTNDYNGKMLRFNPREDIPRRTAVPGPGSTYDAADGGLAERPEPVRRHRGRRRQDQARDLRDGSAQPEPSLDRPGDGHARTRRGSVRTPSTPNATWGPSTYENAAQITRAGNFGWPYCMGSKQAYRDRLDNGAARTDNPAGYVPGGPADRRHRTAGTTATTSATTRRTTRASSSSRTRPAPAPTPARSAATTSGGRAATRATATAAPSSRVRARRDGVIAAPNYGATPTQGCPYVTNSGLTVMNGPVYRYAGRCGQLAPLARVLGRPLVPAQQRRPVRQARPAAGSGHRPERRPADLRRLPARHADVGRLVHGLEVRS